jgi:WD40 repeat protein
MPGWPILIGAHPNFKPFRGVCFADMNGDGDLEIITSSTDSRIYAWDLSGAAMPGFPVATIGWCQYAPSVADMDGDGDLEIVQCTRGTTSGGRLYAVDHLGNVLPGFPISVNNNNVESCPTLIDLDGDGVMEIIVGERAYPIGRIHIFRLDGTEWGGNWPVAMDHVPTCTAAVGDVDSNGSLEIFTMSYTSMYLLRSDGTNMPGWPQSIPNANFSYQSPALADLDGDGDLEIVVGAHQTAAGCYVFHHDGTLAAGWPKLADSWTYCPPTVADLDGDGSLEIIDGQAGYVSPPSNCFWAWSATGVTRSGFPYVTQNGGGSEGPLTVADVNNDGRKEIFADSNLTVGGNGFLYGVDADGNDLGGFPLRPLGFTYLNGATIADADHDGDYELCVLSYHAAGVDVNLYDLQDPKGSSAGDWSVYHARNSRGGLYDAGGSFAVGDLNCDGAIDAFDIEPFVLALTDPGQYALQYPSCDANLADINGDGAVDAFDIEPFITLLVGP